MGFRHPCRSSSIDVIHSLMNESALKSPARRVNIANNVATQIGRGSSIKRFNFCCEQRPFPEKRSHHCTPVSTTESVKASPNCQVGNSNMSQRVSYWLNTLTTNEAEETTNCNVGIFLTGPEE